MRNVVTDLVLWHHLTHRMMKMRTAAPNLHEISPVIRRIELKRPQQRGPHKRADDHRLRASHIVRRWEVDLDTCQVNGRRIRFAHQEETKGGPTIPRVRKDGGLLGFAGIRK